jgi:hypothetical protein
LPPHGTGRIRVGGRRDARSTCSKDAALSFYTVRLDRPLQGDLEELTARGVKIQEEPNRRPHGIDAAFRDPSGLDLPRSMHIAGGPGRAVPKQEGAS